MRNIVSEDYVTLVRCGNLPSGEPLARFKEAEDIESHWGVNLNDDEEKEPSYAESVTLVESGTRTG